MKNIETSEQKNIESIAKNISSLATAVTVLLDGRLKRKTLLILLANSSGYPQKVVDEILQALENLEKDFLK